MNEPAGADLSGQSIGPYLLTRPVGAGAGGEVYLALEQPSGVAVALKLMSPALDLAVDAKRRFDEEMRALQALQHPDIVACIDSGRWRGRSWYAMEWLRGHDLSRYTQPARLLPEPLALRIAARLARALAFAHRQGFLHRDVKPANVRVDLPSDLVKLTDFGVSKGQDTTQTASGVLLGTPVYMAPELLAGEPAAIRSDLYALGVVLFELLTGRRPHEASSLGELLRLMATAQAPDIRSLRPELPQALAQTVADLLSPDPDRRPGDGDALADVLERAIPCTITAGSAPRGH